MTKVIILTAWLEAEDYPKLLASADIGISLHMSSSKLGKTITGVRAYGHDNIYLNHGHLYLYTAHREYSGEGPIRDGRGSCDTNCLQIYL